MGVDLTPFIRGETTGAASLEDRRDQAELARRLEAPAKRIDEIRDELDALAFEVENGP